MENTDYLTQGHTVRRYDSELAGLHGQLRAMGELVVKQLQEALALGSALDMTRARQLIAHDSEVDRLEVAADESIFELIARRCPVGADLRVVITVSKSVSDLEKIGDEAVRIVSLILEELANTEGHQFWDKVQPGLDHIGSMALAGLIDAVGLFEVWDESKALRVIEGYREIDSEFKSELRSVMTGITRDGLPISSAVNFILMAKSFERIAHHAQNLAEYAIFEMKGIDMRAEN
jgi:phosphate transport system protein